MNKKSFLSLHKIISILLPALAVVIAAAYLLAMKNDFEYDISHFKAGSAAFLIFASAAVAALVVSAVSALLCGKKLNITADPSPTPISLFGAILSIIVCIGIFITELKSGMADIELSKETVGRVTPILMMQLVGSILILFVGAAITLYCIDSQRGKTAHKIVSILAPISINLTMFACYFDFEQPLNGPVRNITTVVQCAMLLFLLSEARLAFGGRLTSPFYVFSSAVTASVGMGFSLGGILFKIVDLTAADPNETFLRLGLYVAVSCIAIDRLLALPKIIGDSDESGEPDKAEETATEE